MPKESSRKVDTNTALEEVARQIQILVSEDAPVARYATMRKGGSVGVVTLESDSFSVVHDYSSHIVPERTSRSR